MLIFITFISNGNIIGAIMYTLLDFIFIYLALLIPFNIINAISMIKNNSKKLEELNYKNVLENNLTKTQLGIEELHKLYSFKAFIKDFGHFVNKKVDEVVLWDRYLSYAQVFGLTKEIMNSGYKELIDNSSFQIDNIDNINLYNIEIK